MKLVMVVAKNMTDGERRQVSNLEAKLGSNFEAIVNGDAKAGKMMKLAKGNFGRRNKKGLPLGLVLDDDNKCVWAGAKPSWDNLDHAIRKFNLATPAAPREETLETAAPAPETAARVEKSAARIVLLTDGSSNTADAVAMIQAFLAADPRTEEAEVLTLLMGSPEASDFEAELLQRTGEKIGELPALVLYGQGTVFLKHDYEAGLDEFAQAYADEVAAQGDDQSDNPTLVGAGVGNTASPQESATQ